MDSLADRAAAPASKRVAHRLPGNPWPVFSLDLATMLNSRAALAAWVCVALSWPAQALAQSAAVAPTQRPTPVARTAVSAPDGLLQQLVLSAQECPAFAKLASDYRARFSAPMQV